MAPRKKIVAPASASDAVAAPASDAAAPAPDANTNAAPETNANAAPETNANAATDAATDAAAPAVAVGAEGFASIETIAKNLTLIGTVLKDTTQAVKALQKDYNKLVKAASKGRGRGRRAPTLAADGTKRNPSGFAKPAPLNQAMCDFMQVPFGTEEPRQVVTKTLNSYIKDKNLQNPENRKFILPDETLKKLLGLNDGENLSYFNLQTYIGRLFVPKPLAAAPPAVVAA
jgi:hypothetical protein